MVTSQYFQYLSPLASVSPSDCLLIGVDVDAIYLQTPGPHAGKLAAGREML